MVYSMQNRISTFWQSSKVSWPPTAASSWLSFTSKLITSTLFKRTWSRLWRSAHFQSSDQIIVLRDFDKEKHYLYAQHYKPNASAYVVHQGDLQGIMVIKLFITCLTKCSDSRSERHMVSYIIIGWGCRY